MGESLQRGRRSRASAQPVFLSVLRKQDQYVLHSLQGNQASPAQLEGILVGNRKHKGGGDSPAVPCFHVSAVL